ncbi:cupredoxin domain-containing protein [Trujillonella endophytica]|uniref:Plastocyanin n=1 Tax=Trujillonella endophytica TaxID=673521 RepID=A0A1H8VJN3_9ACTN|nr:plastocyanin/azurin family copper-binding protein [Trujillella endophytica]SEP15510.1 Plastocyanin [Trujillella endophytica]
MTRPTGSTPRVRRVRAGILAAALGLLAACGGGDDDDDGGSAASESSTSAASTSASETASGAPGGGATQSGSEEQPAGTLAVTSVDFDFELPSTEIAAGDYTIELTNEGSGTHDLVVERDGADVGGTDTIGPGQTTSLTVTLEPGEYVFYCSVGNHRAMGMEVTVTVT